MKTSFLRLPREVKWLWQRMTRGWADCDTWNMNYYVARVIPEMLTYLKEHKHGIPNAFMVENCPHSTEGPCTACWIVADKRWDDTLERMICGFQAHNKSFELEGDMEYVKKEAEKLEKERVEGMHLFVEHFSTLWD